MKKTIILLNIILFTLASCTKNDGDVAENDGGRANNQEAGVLPEKEVIKLDSNIITFTSKYNGNKIIERSTDTGYKTTYTYIGNLIIQSTTRKGTTSSIEYYYTYKNDKLDNTLIVTNYPDPSTGIATIYKSRNVYTYNSDGTILEEHYDIDATTAVETNSDTNVIYTYTNGNLTKVVESNILVSNDGTRTSYTHEYQYDNKNNPKKNIVGFNKIFSDNGPSQNNVLKAIGSYETTSGEVVTSTTNYTLSYDANDFLTESKASSPSSTIVQYFY